MPSNLDHVIDPSRLDVIDLVRFPVPPGGSSRWSCTRCGAEHLASDSWAVTFDTVRGPVAAVVCPDCSETFRTRGLDQASSSRSRTRARNDAI